MPGQNAALHARCAAERLHDECKRRPLKVGGDCTFAMRGTETFSCGLNGDYQLGQQDARSSKEKNQLPTRVSGSSLESEMYVGYKKYKLEISEESEKNNFDQFCHANVHYFAACSFHQDHIRK